MEQGIIETINNKIKLINTNIVYNLDSYNNIVSHFNTIETKQQVTLAIVAKYLDSQDTYLSLTRAIEHASFKLDINVKVEWLDSENLIENADLIRYDGFIVPGGFGSRGIGGKLQVVSFARQYNKPILGICLGMQIMAVDIYNITKFGRSKEWENDAQFTNADDIVDIIDVSEENMGNTMRLGNKAISLNVHSKSYTLYNACEINERHRHRYNINHHDDNIISTLTNNSMVIAGVSVEDKFIEIIEYKDNDFYIGCQYHPEYNTSYQNPHPLFVGLLSHMLPPV
jgi:CTP synthase